MVNERRDGGLLVPLGPELQACPWELLRQRRGHDGQPQYLVRWSLVRSEERAAGGGSSAGPDAGSVSLWMSAEEACASCPALLGEGKPAGPRAEEERAAGPFPAGGAAPDEASLREMEADVGSLVRRAGRQLGGTGAPEAASVLNTVHVLSAYAGIGSLAGAFRETGALDLLAKMLCHKEKQICRSAGKMLRVLASHDAGSRSYILLSLSQQDGAEQRMDFDSRYTLLELFAEMMSSEEHCMSFEGIHLPQIPGKQLFALVKRYLRVTSLLDELGSSEEQGGEQPESSRVKQEFEFSMAMAGLIVELLRAMGWEHSHEPEPPARQEAKPRTARSIFQPKTPTCFAAPVPVLSPNHGAQKKQGGAFLTPSDFADRSSYVEYVQAQLVRGMRVRLLEDCGEVRAGEEGEFLHSTNRMHAAQVLWQSTGRTYWMHWHMLEIIGFGDQRDDPAGQEKEYNLIESFNLDKVAQPFFSRPLGGLCSLPYLGEQPSKAAETLSRAEWWELLFFVRQLEAQEQEEIAGLVQREQAEQLPGLDEDALIRLPVPAGLAQKVLRVLEERSRGSARGHLRSSRVYGKYWLGRGAERDGGGSPAASSEGAGCGSAGTGAAPAEAARAEDGVCAVLKSDSQLFGELLEREGLRFPEAPESRACGGCKGASGRGSLEEVAQVAEAIRSSGCEAELRVAGLQHMVRVLQEEPEPEQQEGGEARGGPGTREKLVKAAVELLSAEAAEKRVVVLALRLVALLMERRDWRVPFAMEGGVRAVLACMRQHAASALVQQAGLAALKVLVGAGAGEPGGAVGKPPPLSHGDAQLLREVFASIGSACGEGSPGLLSAIPAAVRAMQSVPGGASGVRNGLLVLRMLVDGHRGLAERLVSGELPAVLQSCWRDGQGAGGPTALLALGVINCLAEHRLPLGPETPGAEALLEAREPAGGPGDGALSEDVVVALERQLCGGGPVPSGEASQERRCFQMLLRSLELLGAEKAVGLRILRILNKFLDGYQEDALPWHECVEPCLSSLSTHGSDREVVQEVVGFLHRLAAASKDCAVAMCRAGAREALGKALEKHSSAVPMAPALLELLSDCEKFTGLHRTLTGSILAGCIQLALGQIEEHRRSQRPVSIPFFDVFLRNLCRGSSVEVREDKCWEKVQVSSNPHRASKLTDRNPKTYWESNGSTGSHFITVHMQCGVVVREMSMLVASEDSSYMPARVVVLGGDSPAAVGTVLNTVSVLPSASRVVLLRNMTRFWPVIQIRVKRCQQGGIDTRVRGIEVLGPKPTFWPVFREQLCRRTFLCCTARALAWCQEIRRDRGRLLQLFGKLNRALRHEQDFAERFLPDDEAARALGRACWEALVSPLVQSITSPDPSGVSPLAWLLSEYLGSGEPAQRPPARGAAFGSCVRLLTQLLVHVDPGGVEPEEARAAGGQEGRNKEAPPRVAAAQKPSGLWGIVRCWRGVVQQQVQRFLEAAGQAPDVAERYCGLYRHLRGATEELFGQRAAFVVALGQGFAGALLRLSFLAALHVSERFARYLDGKIQELHGAAGSTGLLQQVLEPFVIFSGLEFAHTFEHFYRLYLGERLLAQGPSWLEGAVLEQIGLCFPRRFPQEMLSDLAESEELRRQFRLFQLQERDKRLLGLGAGPESPEDEAPGEASAAEAPEVTVLALSPRCWPVSPLCHMDEPGRFFSAALSSPLGDFAAFCGQSQSQRGWACARPRRLQWTWLGRAELRFGDCVLHVSTLQMYVLLRFNGAEEVAVESLLRATGLPAELLQQALAPLTEGEGVLVQSCALGGALRLNRAALAQASGRHLRLLPRQRYLRAERAESGALERKRNILCCLITRVLKAEKQLHIDNLVFRVIDACQKGELGPGLQFLSFCCHSVDVLSCVLHLLNQGYLRRQEGRPHVLEYVPAEPRTPLGGQAQMVFQRQLPATYPDEDSKDCLYQSNSGTDRSEEFLLAMLQVPMGHTLSLEEAKLLMNQTVQRVQDTLSIPEDVARHLLMHCRWNVDFLIHCYVEDRRSLLIASGLEVEDAQRPPSPGTHCPVCVNQLCPTEKPPSLCCMHYCCKPCWNEYLTTRIEQNMVLSCTCPISECRAQPTAAFIYSIVSSKEIIAKSASWQQKRARLQETISFNMADLVDEGRATGEAFSIVIHNVLTELMKYELDKWMYEKALLRGYVECCSNLTWCTNPQGCDQILLKDGLGYEAACSKCSWISCFNCNFPEAHYPASCSHMSQWVDDDGYYEGMTSEAQSKHLAKLISKHCPSCQAQIEKNEGCLHMTCAKCNHGFCWRCLKPWRPTHKDYYNCSAMVSKAAWQEKRFQDYNERCTFHHRAREFATSLRNRVSSISEMPKIRTLTFVLHACKVLEQARKVLAYSCVYSYYNQDTESIDIVEQQTESLELHTNALQILLEEALLQYQDLTSSLQLLKAEHFNTGLELVHRIKERLFAILWHSTQDFRVGLETSADPGQNKVKLSNVPSSAPACVGPRPTIFCESPNTDEDGKQNEDEEYDPQWQEDYDDDDDDLDEDNFLFDDESDNLDCDSYFDDDDAYD